MVCGCIIARYGYFNPCTLVLLRVMLHVCGRSQGLVSVADGQLTRGVAVSLDTLSVSSQWASVKSPIQWKTSNSFGIRTNLMYLEVVWGDRVSMSG